MSAAPRLVWSDSALLIEFEPRVDPAINARAVAVAERIGSSGIAGVRDVVPTYRSVAVYFDPLRTDGPALEKAVQEAIAQRVRRRRQRDEAIEVPVCYGGACGPDLPAVAEHAGCAEADVVRLHSARTYRVYMLGFVPGFAYMGEVDERIAMPRKRTPRLRVPPCSVGITGRQTGVYPSATPGGWQLIGRTPVKPLDHARAQPFLFRAGDAVRFVPISIDEYERLASRSEEDARGRKPAMSLVIVKPGLLTTVQDLGRWGHQAEGVPVGGPMDPHAHRLANLLVGNTERAATLEMTLIGPEILFERAGVIAIAGADLSPSVDGHSLPMRTASAVPQGARLRFGARREGARAYLAIAGGIETPPVFESRATQLTSGMGGVEGRALRAADRVPVGVPAQPAKPGRTLQGSVKLPAGGAELRVIPGPEAEMCAEILQLMFSSSFTISPSSDRMAYRLGSGLPTPDVGPKGVDVGPRTSDPGRTSVEIISDATPLGTIQVPPSGEPMLLMADRQTCGGYPRVATVIAADLPLAGQLAPGDWIRFRPCTLAEAMTALIEQERVFVR